MRIDNNNNISFGTNIKVVSPGCFRRITRKMEKIKGCEIIKDWDVGSNSPRGYRENVNLGGTGHIRSCSAGIITKKGKNAPLFWHIYDSPENLDYFSILEDKMEGENAILVGSKSDYFYSKALYYKFQKALRKKSIPTTILKSLALEWQAFMAYTSKDDTMYLCFTNIDKPYEYVKSWKDLKNIFRKIKISPTDNIEFIRPIDGLFIPQNIKKLFKGL